MRLYAVQGHSGRLARHQREGADRAAQADACRLADRETGVLRLPAEGGFTKQGAVNEVAGVVHAGEWVASQRLLASPVARPLIEVLDYAQRTNTIGSLRQSDVSRTITAPAVLAQSQAPTVIVQENKELRETLARLNQRLNDPFVTVDTVTGDMGIKQAQDDYQRLMNNKPPKNKRR